MLTCGSVRDDWTFVGCGFTTVAPGTAFHVVLSIVSEPGDADDGFCFTLAVVDPDARHVYGVEGKIPGAQTGVTAIPFGVPAGTPDGSYEIVVRFDGRRLTWPLAVKRPVDAASSSPRTADVG